MQSTIVFPAAVLLALVAGCRSQTAAPNHPEGAHNLWVNEWFQDRSQAAAVIRQAAVFPGQFVTGSSALTGVGTRDLGILIEHYGVHGGAISVRRGDASDQLYAARVKTVSDAFLAAGVPDGRVTFTDALAGGDGQASHEAAEALSKPPFESGNAGGTATGSSAGSATGLTSQGGVR